MKVKKRVLSFVYTLSFLISLSTGAHAAETTEQRVYDEIVVGSPQFDTNVKYFFVDEGLGNCAIAPYGNVEEVYDYSYYEFDYASITANDVGPRHSDIFLLSVARGATETIKTEKSVSGKIQFSGTVDTKVKSVINLAFKLEADGTYTETWSNTKVYSGPDAPYNSRSYYGAINYDEYTCYVKKYDVYKVYNGNSYINDVQYFGGTVAYESVKVPKAVEYAVDSLQ